MVLPVWADNLIAYSLQMAILAFAGTLLACLFRLRLPRVLLIYWQVLLLGCLLLPAIQNWRHPVQVQTITDPGALAYSIPAAPAVAAEAKSPGPAFSITPEAIGLVLLAGIFLRLVWLGSGFVRLRLFLRNSMPMPEAAPVSEGLLSRIGVRVRFSLSHEIDSPATVGIFRPTVVLPCSFPNMSAECREALVCHELVHARRRDWALILVEEVIRSLYWFHPAVWWLLGRIHLAREQSVDHEVVRLTGRRQPYLNSLLEIARSRGRPKAVPAPLFLRERHLVQRVALLVREVSMSRSRLVVSLAGMAALLAGTAVVAAGWFPLTGGPRIIRQRASSPESVRTAPDPIQISRAAPVLEMAANISVSPPPQRGPAAADSAAEEQQPAADPPIAAPQRDPIRVGANVQESKLIRKIEPVYPDLAKRARVQGRVILVVTVNEDGYVSDIRVNSGHPLLNQAAIDAVRQWRYSPTLLNGVPVPVIATVTVIFALDGGLPDTGSASLATGITPGGPTSGSILQEDGLGGSVLFRATLIDEKGTFSPAEELFHVPELATNQALFERWHRIAESGWPGDVSQDTPVSYMFIVNEAGEIENFMRVQGPQIPELEREVLRVGVVTPGLRGSTPVRSLCALTIRLGGPAVPAQLQMPDRPNGNTWSGTITDSSGVALPGVTVKATNARTGMTTASVTNSLGVYSFADLQPGSYRLSAEVGGFQPRTLPEFPIANGAHIRMNLKMER